MVLASLFSVKEEKFTIDNKEMVADICMIDRGCEIESDGDNKGILGKE
jgi:hypothetical protein